MPGGYRAHPDSDYGQTAACGDDREVAVDKEIVNYLKAFGE